MKAIYLWRVVSDPRSGDGGGRLLAGAEVTIASGTARRMAAAGVEVV